MARSLVLAVLVFLFVGVLVASAPPVNPCTRIHVPRTAVTLFTTTDLSSKTATEGDEIQLPVKQNLVRTGGGIFKFFLPQMKPIQASEAEKRRKNDIKGPVAKPGKVHG